MADKKKFEKPQMEVIKLNSKVGVLAGSDCSTYSTAYSTASRMLDEMETF